MTRLVFVAIALTLAGCNKEPASPVPTPAAPPAAAPVRQEIPITSASQKAVEALKQGRLLRQSFRMPEAVAQFRKAVELDPKFAQAHAYLGLSTEGAESLQHTDQADSLSAGLPEAERLQVQILVAIKRGEEEKSRALRQQLGNLVPSHAGTSIWLGYQALDDRKWEEAAAAFRRAIELDPNDGESYNSLGYALGAQGRYDEAIAALRKYVALMPGEPNPQDSLAEVQMMAGRFDEAEAAFRRAAATPGFWSGWEGVAYTRLYRGDFTLAREALGKAREAAARPVDKLAVGETLAWSYLAEGKPAEALRQVDALEQEARAQNVEARYAWAPLGRALILNDMGKHQEALKQAALALSRGEEAKLPGAESNQLRRATLSAQLLAEARLHKLADADRTLALLKAEASKSPANIQLQSWVHFGQGVLAAARGDGKGALSHWSQCLEDDYTRRCMTKIHVIRRSHWSQCLEDDYTCRWQLSLAQDRAGDKEGAAATRDKLLKTYQRDPVYLYVWARLAGAARTAAAPVGLHKG